MGLPLVASIAAPIIGSLFGNDQASKDRDAANRARQAALAEFTGINIPDIEQQKLLLEQLQSAGTYNPALEQLYNQDPSAMEQITLDPRLRQAQQQALDSISQVAQDGVSSADKASLELLRRQAANEAQAKQQQILQDMQMRGQGGAGAELIARLKNAQSSADRLNNQGLQEEVMKQNNRRAALEQQMNAATNLRTQDYGQQTDLARARDTINQFNTANQQSVSGRNTNRGNEAQMSNLQNQQNISNANVGLRNQQQMNNKDLLQQQYANKMSLANARAGQYNVRALNNDAAAGRTAAMWGNLGQTIGSGFGAFVPPEQPNVQQKQVPVQQSPQANKVNTQQLQTQLQQTNDQLAQYDSNGNRIR